MPRFFVRFPYSFGGMPDSPFSSSGTFFGAFSVIFFLVFAVIIVAMIVMGVRGISQWSKNNNSPLLTIPAKVVGKRMDVRHYHRSSDGSMGGSYNASTDYYVTFEFDNGSRTELRLSGQESGMIFEGDTGMLSFQGTRFIKFERKLQF